MKTAPISTSLIKELQDDFHYALYGDLENGVKWLNEAASAEFVNKYPRVHAAIVKLMEINVEDGED